MFLPQLLIVLLGLTGVILAGYIYRKKRTAQVLVCPLHADCDTVVHSEFSRFFGIPVELMGVMYYAVVAAAYATAAATGGLPSGPTTAVFTLTAGAFLFSVYLTFIQAFTMRQWCSWCLGSAGISTAIFALALWLISWDGLRVLLLQQRLLLQGGHLLGLAVGLGAATVSALLFFRFLRDFQISAFEAEVLRIISQLTWLALAAVVLTGVGLYVPAAMGLNSSPQFLLVLLVLVGLLISSAFLTLTILPRLVSLTFRRERVYPGSQNVPRLRRVAFGFGSVSLLSWYSLFFLMLLPAVPFSAAGGVAAYVLLLAAVAGGSQLLERVVIRRSAV